jgi:UDP-N-acetylmuramate--alanine ligase
LNIDDGALLKALAEFKGVGRRFQRYGDLALPGGGQVTVVDDYGHHPVEMAATLAAARGAFPGRRLVLAFQPHRFTRTRDCFEDFVKVIGRADSVLLAEVYAAGETPIVAADGRAMARAIRIAGKVEPIFVDDIALMAQAAVDNARDGDVLLCMGAGSIGAVPGKIVELLQNNEQGSSAGKGL